LHFHLELLPRFEKVIWAGFEYSTETIINPVPPEDAAAFYRKL
jgi:UDPglucose--hexose-1-phosphate uridylyltransferase